jgi:hypothetical protein
MITVISYYLSEWTDQDINGPNRFVVTKEIEDFIRGCRRHGDNVPEAASQLKLFLGLSLISDEDRGSEGDQPDA